MTIEISLMLSLNMVNHLISIFEFKLSSIMVLKRKDNPNIESPYSDMNIQYENTKIHNFYKKK